MVGIVHTTASYYHFIRTHPYATTYYESLLKTTARMLPDTWAQLILGVPSLLQSRRCFSHLTDPLFFLDS